MIINFDWGSPLYDQSIFLRDLVLRKPLNLSFTPKQLVEEINCIHIAYVDFCEDMIACLYFKKVNKSTLQLKQMAVKPEFQKKGYGRSLVLESEKMAEMFGYSTIVLHARDEATGFYKKLGYEISGDTFLEIGIPHFKMKKNIKKTY